MCLMLPSCVSALTVCQAFHHTGRYLLSGGLDCIVNLWCLPQLPDRNSGSDRVTVLHYPHFSTSAVHSNFVDWLVLPSLRLDHLFVMQEKLTVIVWLSIMT